jgi:hypothetical protein
MSDQLNVTAGLIPQKELWYLLNRKLDGINIRSGRSGEDKNLYPYRQSTTIPRFSSMQPSHYTGYVIPDLMLEHISITGKRTVLNLRPTKAIGLALEDCTQRRGRRNRHETAI